MTHSEIEFRTVIRSPPETVDDANDFLRSVWAQRPDVAAADRMALETVLSELVTNVIQNNPHRQVHCDVNICIRPDLLVLETSDTGDLLEGMPTSSGEMPPEVAEHGRGLALVRLLVDNFSYRQDASRNVWLAHRSRRDAEPGTAQNRATWPRDLAGTTTDVGDPDQ